MNEEPMAYIAKAPCGCTKFATVDTPEHAKDNAKEIAWCIKQGYIIERVTCAWVRENWRMDCDVCRKPKKQAKAIQQQTVMELV